MQTLVALCVLYDAEGCNMLFTVIINSLAVLNRVDCLYIMYTYASRLGEYIFTYIPVGKLKNLVSSVIQKTHKRDDYWLQWRNWVSLALEMLVRLNLLNMAEVGFWAGLFWWEDAARREISSVGTSTWTGAHVVEHAIYTLHITFLSPLNTLGCHRNKYKQEIVHL